MTFIYIYMHVLYSMGMNEGQTNSYYAGARRAQES